MIRRIPCRRRRSRKLSRLRDRIRRAGGNVASTRQCAELAPPSDRRARFRRRRRLDGVDRRLRRVRAQAARRRSRRPPGPRAGSSRPLVRFPSLAMPGQDADGRDHLLDVRGVVRRSRRRAACRVRCASSVGRQWRSGLAVFAAASASAAADELGCTNRALRLEASAVLWLRRRRSLRALTRGFAAPRPMPLASSRPSPRWMAVVRQARRCRSRQPSR